MTHLIEVSPRKPGADPASRSVLSEAAHLGAANLRSAAVSRLYRLNGAVSADDASKIARDLLCDPVTESFKVLGQAKGSGLGSGPSVDIWYKTNVTDPAAGAIETALRGMGFLAVQVRCGTRVRFEGEPARTLEPLIGKFLANAVIQDWTLAA